VIKQRGDGVTLEAEFRDENGNLFDPDSQEVKVYDPNGALQASPVPVKQSLGIWRIVFTLPEDAVTGIWGVSWKAVKGTYPETEPYSFIVEE